MQCVRSMLRSLIIVASACALSGCMTAPLVQPVPAALTESQPPLSEARIIDCQSADSAVLRGIHLPAAHPHNPDHRNHETFIVLHLLPSGTSISSGLPIGIGTIGLDTTLQTLADIGFNSVIFDYRGIGMSDGPIRHDHLLPDGRAMYQRAIELAGGREDRIVLRAGSLGSLIVADLLTRGAQPAGVVLFAPIRSTTIVKHAARERSGPLASLIAPLFMRAPAVANIDTPLDRAPRATLIYLAQRDPFLPTAEMNLITHAAAHTDHTIIIHPGDHQSLILRSWGFTLDDDTFSGRSTPELLAAERDLLETLRRSAPDNPAAD